MQYRHRLAIAAVASVSILVAASSVALAQTTYGPASGGSIPDNNATGISSTISVVDIGTVTSFNSLTITGLTHTWVGDLVATLTHNGTSVELFDRIASTTSGGFGDSSNFSGTYVFVPSGGGNLVTAAGGGDSSYNIPAGTYNTAPNTTAGGSSSANGALTDFNGINLTGNWVLNISDRVGSDTGSFTSWSFNATVDSTPPPPPPPGTYTGTGGNLTDGTFNIGPNTTTPGVSTFDIAVTDNFTIGSFDQLSLGEFVHTLVGDLNIQLEHVDTGTTVDIVNRLGIVDTSDPFDPGDDSNLNGNYVFTEGGTSLLTTAENGNTSFTIPGGTYARSTSLDPNIADPDSFAAFVGESAFGTWRLRVTDFSEGDTGSFSTWGFKVTPVVTVPEPSSAVLALPALAMLSAVIAKRRKQSA